MKNLKHIIIASVVVILSITLVNAQSSQMSNDLTAALKKGNSIALAKHFGHRVELSILNKEGIYSQSQAQQIMTKFFKEMQVSDFKVKHSGGKIDTRYIIGDLTTTKGNFRINFLLKKYNAIFKIYQLHIEKE